MNIELYNCNNIDTGSIKITEGVLNIKYAINGTGKSTLSKAISKSIFDRINAGVRGTVYLIIHLVIKIGKVKMF